MYSRHSHSQQSLSLLTMINKPPRPPCWRDFIAGEPQRPPRKSHASATDFTDLAQLQQQRSNSDGEAAARPAKDTSHVVTTKASSSSHHKKHKKHEKHEKHERGKLHRTRSELTISQADLPEMQHMTINLADANPRETGLCRGGTRIFDAQIYLDDNAKRCEKWLAGVHASQPLTDVAFSQGSGDELEIPEENWHDLQHLKTSPVLVSTSGSDIDSVSVCGCGGLRNEKAGAKTRVKNRRYSDIRVPQRTRDQGGRAQTLPTPGRLKRLARLAESESQQQGASSSRRKSAERSKRVEKRPSAAPEEKAKTSQVVKDGTTGSPRKVADMERIPFKDQTSVWQVTEIDQNLLLAGSDDCLKDASIAATGTASDLDRKVTGSTESLLEETKPKTARRVSAGAESKSQPLQSSATAVSTDKDERTSSNQVKEDLQLTNVDEAINTDLNSTDLVVEEHSSSPRPSTSEVNRIDEIHISVDIHNESAG